jgi:S-phase kinase-associated protein 1
MSDQEMDNVQALDEDEVDMNEMITLVSKDNVKVRVSRRDAALSNLITTVMQCGNSFIVIYLLILNVILDSETTEINVPNVDEASLLMVVQYLEHHQGIEPAEIQRPLRSSNMHVIVETWDADFINSFKTGKIFQLILASNYLDIKSLLQLGCAKIASMIKGKSPEEIQKILKGEEALQIPSSFNDSHAQSTRSPSNQEGLVLK